MIRGQAVTYRWRYRLTARARLWRRRRLFRFDNDPRCTCLACVVKRIEAKKR